MKIAGTGRIQTPSLRRAQRGGTSESNFADHIGGSKLASGAGKPMQAGAIDGLLAIQEVDDEGRRRRQAKDNGEAILDRLDEIRHALLTGNIDPERLERLLKQVRRQRLEFSDPGLRDVLDAIELRAAVELAKMGRAA